MPIDHIPEKRIDLICDKLANEGFIILRDFLPEPLAVSLLDEAEILSKTHFSTAGIGRNDEQQINTQVRTDSTLWLTHDSGYQTEYLEFMESLRQGLNRRLFMGLFDFECHFSHYQQGDFYQKHLDAFKGRSNRALSTVYYLNPNWSEADGGELIIYSPEKNDEPISKVTPLFNQCIIFLSDMFPHEVLASNKDRFSIAGWFRVNGTTQQHLDPSN